jgi:hypothetical protein
MQSLTAGHRNKPEGENAGSVDEKLPSGRL